MSATVSAFPSGPITPAERRLIDLNHRIGWRRFRADDANLLARYRAASPAQRTQITITAKWAVESFPVDRDVDGGGQ